MSWQIKSTKSYQAAEALIASDLLDNSVNCSYYSIVQVMYHILSEELGMTEQEINQDQIHSKKSTHSWLVNRIVILIKGRPVNKLNAVKINNRIVALKENRVKADYGEGLTTREVADESLKESSEIKAKLTDIFGI